jgi:hypothetical protein
MEGVPGVSPSTLTVAKSPSPDVIDKGSESQNLGSREEYLLDLHIRAIKWKAPRKKQYKDSMSSEDNEWLKGSMAKGLMKGVGSPGTNTDEIEVRLPDYLRRVLSIRELQIDATARESIQDRLAKDLLRGRNLYAERGIQTWMIGEHGHEEFEASEDEWAGCGQEWAGEL